MSTCSSITKVEDNGECKTIYCHNDGYLEGVGKMLLDHYSSPEQIDKLLKLGDLSTLGEEPIDDPLLWDDYNHSKGCRTYIGRGDNIEDCVARWYINPLDVIKHEGQDFNYFFIQGNWYYIEDFDAYNKLSDSMIDLKTGKTISQLHKEWDEENKEK